MRLRFRFFIAILIKPGEIFESKDNIRTTSFGRQHNQFQNCGSFSLTKKRANFKINFVVDQTRSFLFCPCSSDLDKQNIWPLLLIILLWPKAYRQEICGNYNLPIFSFYHLSILIKGMKIFNFWLWQEFIDCIAR